MANQEHVTILKRGIDSWNRWREEYPDARPDLSDADFNGLYLGGANLRSTNLARAKLNRTNFIPQFRQAVPITRTTPSGERHTSNASKEVRVLPSDLSGANLNEAELVSANLGGAFLCCAHLVSADLGGAILTTTDLRFANLHKARLIGANLNQAKLDGANLVEADFTKANLSNCHVYGVNVWQVGLDESIQKNLVVTPIGEPVISVDNLELAQFIYLLLNNDKIRGAIDTITTKVVLILGRFTLERKAVLDAIRDELCKHDYIPALFDFDQPASRNLTETVSTLAHMARFVIADITDAKSIPQELQRIVPALPSVSVQPLILSSEYEYGMFKDFMDYHWVLPPYRYESVEGLLASLEEKVIIPAEAKAKQTEMRRRAFEEELAK